MTDSRMKGKKAEQELAKLLADELGSDIVERVGHRQAGSKDLCDVFCGPFDIEVKRYKRPTESLIEGWWEQAGERCRDHQIPALAYRGDGQKWRIMTMGRGYFERFDYTDTRFLEGFCQLVRESLPVKEALMLKFDSSK